MIQKCTSLFTCLEIEIEVVGSFEQGGYDERIRPTRSFKSVVVEVTDVGFLSKLPLSPILDYASLVRLL